MIVQLVQTITLGLLIGGVYALMASGLTLIFGVMNIINVGQGALIVLSAYLTFALWSRTGIDPILAVVLTTPVMFAVGYALYRLMISRIHGSVPTMSVLLTFALAVMLEGIMGLVWKPVSRAVIPDYSAQSFLLGPYFIPKTYVYGCIAAVLVLAALWLMLTYTRLGRAIRATSQNPMMAQLTGVDARSVAALTFAIGIATTGAGGSILSVLGTFDPSSHYLWISRLLGIIVLGGMGSLPGALMGALLLGSAEIFTQTYISTQWATVVPYIVIFAVLLFRPQGLLGTTIRTDVPA